MKKLTPAQGVVVFLTTVCISLICLIELKIYNHSQTLIVPIVLEFLGLFGAVFIAVLRKKENTDTETAFSQAVAAFLSYPIILVLLGVLCASILSSTPLFEPIDEGAGATQGLEGGVEFITGMPSPNPLEECHIPLSAWEADPYFEKTDEYMGYHVAYDDLSEVLFCQLSMTVLLIPVRGQYDASVLNFSPYGENTKLARQSEEGYNFYCDMEKNSGETRRDHQIYLLNDANHYRQEADKFYSVSDNQKMLGGNAVLLGDLHNEMDKKFQCYSDAFVYYQTAYRSAISEGRPAEYLSSIVDQMAYVSSKLINLPMDQWECTSAPHIVLTFRRLTESFES